MKFSSKEDIDVPVEAVFAQLCEFATFEDAARLRGAEVQRTHQMDPPGPGQSWRARFPLQGRQRDLKLEIATFAPPHELVLDIASDGVTGEARFELMALSPERSRIMLSFEIRPLTVAARLLIQSLRLAKPQLNKRFKLRCAEHARQIEERHRRPA